MFLLLSEKAIRCSEKDIIANNIIIDIDAIVLIRPIEEDAPENGSNIVVEANSSISDIEVYETVSEIVEKLRNINEV